jgi:hypothetical protein
MSSANISWAVRIVACSVYTLYSRSICKVSLQPTCDCINKQSHICSQTHAKPQQQMLVCLSCCLDGCGLSHGASLGVGFFNSALKPS